MTSRYVYLLGVCVGLLAITLSAQKPSLDYPQWRGQPRDGSASAFTEPKAWPDTLSQQWRTEVGLDYATPLVVGDRLYVFSRRGENEVMSALEAASGKMIWNTGLWTSEPRQAGQAAVAKAGTIVFSLEDDGELVVGRVGPAAFEALRRYKVADSETWTQQAISGNRLFVKDLSTLALWTIP